MHVHLQQGLSCRITLTLRCTFLKIHILFHILISLKLGASDNQWNLRFDEISHEKPQMFKTCVNGMTK